MPASSLGLRRGESMQFALVILVVFLLMGVAVAFVKFLLGALVSALVFFLLMAWLSSLVK